MKTLYAVAALGLAAGIGAPALAQNQTAVAAPTVEVVERNARGQAIKVRIEGRVYDVCMSEAQDSCIQPRAAGFNWGDVPLDHWPGRPASEG